MNKEQNLFQIDVGDLWYLFMCCVLSCEKNKLRHGLDSPIIPFLFFQVCSILLKRPLEMWDFNVPLFTLLGFPRSPNSELPPITNILGSNKVLWNGLKLPRPTFYPVMVYLALLSAVFPLQSCECGCVLSL
jgi:hypothetical protein